MPTLGISQQPVTMVNTGNPVYQAIWVGHMH